jgi:hypothetical protein
MLLECVHELNLGRVDFKLSAKRVVDSFSSPKHDVVEFGIVIQNCKALFRQFYINSRVEFVQKHANKTVHKLAKAVILSVSF